MEFTAPQVVTIIVALIGLVSGVLAFLKGRKKERADVAESITVAAGRLIDEYKERLAEVEEKISCQEAKLELEREARRRLSRELDVERDARKRLEKTVGELETERDEILNGVMALCSQIRKLGYEPVWEPSSPEE